MGRIHESINESLIAWIDRQAMFFVATAPPLADGHINLSPKGLDTFRVIGPNQVAYLDLTGSGIETVAHLKADGRITFMFCAFEGPPRIIRLFGRGVAVEATDPAWSEMSARFAEVPGARAVIVVDVDRIADSCGYAVPLMDFRGDRSKLVEWAEHRGPEGLVEYQVDRNAESIDGLQGLRRNP